MKQLSFSAMIFAAVVSVFLFSGQQRRPVAPPPQRQPVPQVQRQTTPPKPEAPSDLGSSVTQMPFIYLLPEDIKFPEMPPGSPRTITLLGDPKAEGLYVTRTLIPKGKQIIPHTHSDSRTVIVLSGTYYYGFGEEFDERGLVALLPGSFFTEPAGVPHFTWAKDGDVIIQTTAVGPSGTQIIPDKKTDTAQGRP